MKYLWYAFLGLISLGFLGMIASVAAVILVFQYFGHDLPDYTQLKNYEPPIVTRLYAGDGRLLAEYAQEKRIFVPIAAIPDRVKNAFIAAEDQNFYRHEGVDLLAVMRAVASNVKNIGSGRRPIGASTITQQVAKNFLLGNEVSYARKIKEAILAYRMEQAMSKDRLLELYLNEIFLGARAYGVAAAAQQYFNKSLDELSVAEVAYLAALPKAPNNYHPVKNHDQALERRNWVIGRMREDGYINATQADMAQAVPLQTVLNQASDVVNASFFAEEVRRELATRYGSESLYGGGLVVRTTIDPRLQEIAVRSLRDGLVAYDRRHGWRGPLQKLPTVGGWRERLAAMPPLTELSYGWRAAAVIDVTKQEATLGFSDGSRGNIPLDGLRWARQCVNECYGLGPEIIAATQVLEPGDVVAVSKMPQTETNYELQQIPRIQGALVAMDPHTGRVLAMQGGWKYGISEFNRVTQAQRQPGSAFKPFVYLAALERGFTPATLVLDAPFVIEDRPGHFWSPENYSGEYYGPTPIRVGVEKSKNLMTVRMADYLGMESIAQVAKRFGITDSMPHQLSAALGATETTVLRLTTAYAILVNGGKEVQPSIIDRVQDRYGKTIFKHDGRTCTDCGPLMQWDGQATPEIPDPRAQVADPRTAYQIVSILEGVVQRGTAAAIKSLNRPLAGKTGTTNESKDAWFIGFSPDLVVGVYMGFDEPQSLGKRETGASVAVPVFQAFMQEALEQTPVSPFRVPPGIRQVQINADTGARVRAGDSHVIWEAFITGTEPSDEVMYLSDGGVQTLPTSALSFGYHGEGAAPGSTMATQPAAGGGDIIVTEEPPPDISGTGGLY